MADGPHFENRYVTNGPKFGRPMQYVKLEAGNKIPIWQPFFSETGSSIIFDED